MSAESRENKPCLICDQEQVFSWTDTHGVAQCRCGTPYRIYHYDENDKRIDKGPEIAVTDEAVPVLRAYWSAFKRTIPGGHSFPGGYELASEEDHKAFSDYWEEHGPKPAALGAGVEK